MIDDNAPVAEADHAAGLRSNIRLVRDQHDGEPAFAVEALEDRHDLAAGLGVERPCRLVGQQHERLIYERPGNCDALLLSARQLCRSVTGAIT
jgi:hypothetical protein